MLDDHDQRWLVEQIIGSAELLGQQITPKAAAMLAEDLSAYPRAVLAAALSRVRTEHTGKLTPKAILDRIDEAMGRPSGNEAWAIALTALDQNATVVWTEEMQQAWALAKPLAASGDLIGARMTFKDSYERLVRTAREERRTPIVWVSEGWDAEGRAKAVAQAVKLGYLTTAQAKLYAALPPPAFSIPALMAGRVEVASNAPRGVYQRLIALRSEFAGAAQRRMQERERKAEEARAVTAAQKAEAQRMSDAMQQEEAA